MAEVDHRHRFPCTQCGSQLNYEPGTTEMGCGHCGNRHRIRLSSEPILEYDYFATLNDLPEAAPNAVHMTNRCESCGAETEFDRNVHADECPFCGTEFVLDSVEERFIQPKALLPFRVTGNEAKQQYSQWLKRLWFAPNKLKKYARQDQGLNGVYVPYWNYDCTAHTNYNGERGDIYYVRQRVRVNVNGRWVMREQMVPKIRWTPTRGRVTNRFDNTLVYASDALPREIARELEPWDLNVLRPYQEEFLSGFQSEVYQTDLDDGFELAQHKMQPQILHSIRADIGGDEQRIREIDTRYQQVRFQHILLPFWVAGFRFSRKTYQFIINGRTGEVQGDRPWSKWKIAFAALGILAVVLVFMTLASNQSVNFDSGGFRLPQQFDW